jgi:hypothetical protein
MHRRWSTGTRSGSWLVRLAIGIVGATGAGVLAPISGMPSAFASAPEPSPVPKRWQLDVEIGPLRLTRLNVEGRGPESYFYMTYKVTNNSGKDLLLAPSFELATSEGVVLRSGRGVPVGVTQTLLERFDNPLLLDQISMLGMMLQGPENAKEGLVVWPAASLDIDRLVVYAGGFSGETAAIEVPDPQTHQMSRVVLRKTLCVTYNAAGELDPTTSTPMTVLDQRWVMR